MAAPSPIDAAILARFPPGTSQEEAALYIRRANGNVRTAIDTAAADRRRGLRPHAGPNEYFVGGGQSSGQAVVTPGAKPASTDDAIETVFAKARENGAKDATREFGHQPAAQAFAGTGRRLGHLEGPSPTIQAVKKFERRIRITFWENGFQIEDGPLRSFTDPTGERFLESINRGFIPRELVAQYGDVDLSVDLVDRREEQYVPPAYVAFGGTGRTMQPSASPTGAAASPGATAPSSQPSTRNVVVDETLETCKIAVMNLMGKRCEVVVNPTVHTVLDLRVLASETMGTPALPIHSFELMVRDLPPRTLSDDTMTVDAAGCKNATVMMRKK